MKLVLGKRTESCCTRGPGLQKKHEQGGGADNDDRKEEEEERLRMGSK